MYNSHCLWHEVCQAILAVECLVFISQMSMTAAHDRKSLFIEPPLTYVGLYAMVMSCLSFCSSVRFFPFICRLQHILLLTTLTSWAVIVMLLTDWCWQVSRCGWPRVSLRLIHARRWSAAQWCEQRALFCRLSPDCSSSPTWLTYTSCSSLSTSYVVYFVHRFVLAWDIAATL